MSIKYHLSKVFLGNNVILTPKVPISSSIDAEGDIPRICFSVNIFYCVRSIGGGTLLKVFDLAEFKNRHISKFDKNYDEEKFNFSIINPSIYITKDKLFTPPAHGDFRHNKELWSLNPIDVKFAGYLCLNSLLSRELKITNMSNTLEVNTYLKNLNKRIYKPHQNINNLKSSW